MSNFSTLSAVRSQTSFGNASKKLSDDTPSFLGPNDLVEHPNLLKRMRGKRMLEDSSAVGMTSIVDCTPIGHSNPVADASTVEMLSELQVPFKPRPGPSLLSRMTSADHQTTPPPVSTIKKMRSLKVILPPGMQKPSNKKCENFDPRIDATKVRSSRSKEISPRDDNKIIENDEVGKKNNTGKKTKKEGTKVNISGFELKNPFMKSNFFQALSKSRKEGNMRLNIQDSIEGDQKVQGKVSFKKDQRISLRNHKKALISGENSSQPQILQSRLPKPFDWKTAKLNSYDDVLNTISKRHAVQTSIPDESSQKRLQSVTSNNKIKIVKSSPSPKRGLVDDPSLTQAKSNYKPEKTLINFLKQAGRQTFRF